MPVYNPYSAPSKHNREVIPQQEQKSIMKISAQETVKDRESLHVTPTLRPCLYKVGFEEMTV